jgi:hypothetical protein
MKTVMNRNDTNGKSIESESTRKKTIGESSRVTREPCITPKAPILMRRGYRSSKRHSPKFTGITRLLKVVISRKQSSRSVTDVELTAIREGIEDLTGGIGTTIIPTNILSKDRFWEDLLKVNEEFLFGAGTQEWYDPAGLGRDGIHGGHAYSILGAKSYKNEKLLKVKNPWGQGEWNGPWSDGSSQWNAESIAALGHTFGDDGVFWIRYTDLLKKYNTIWRTRLFTDEWNVTQQWTSLSVPWSGDFQDTKFEVVLTKPAHTVIILSQLDSRYYRGFEGQYNVKLSFRVHEKGQEEYITRTINEDYWKRSVSVELDLEAGSYEVRLKLSAVRDSTVSKAEDVIKTNWLNRREKLLKIGLSYDLAHAKGQLPEVEKVEEETQASEKKDVATTPEDDIAPSEAKPTSEELPLRPAQASSEAPRPQTFGDAYATSEVGSYADADADKDKVVEDPPKEDDKPKDDPWGAVCVVGLRVYCKEADATVEIVRPKKEEVKKPELDVDDPAKDLALEKEPVKSEEVEGEAGEVKKAEEIPEQTAGVAGGEEAAGLSKA